MGEEKGSPHRLRGRQRSHPMVFVRAHTGVHLMRDCVTLRAFVCVHVQGMRERMLVRACVSSSACVQVPMPVHVWIADIR